MDDLHRHLFKVLIDRQWQHGMAAAVDVTLLGRFYQRFAAHAVEIARRVIFQATGKLPAEKQPTTPYQMRRRPAVSPATDLRCALGWRRRRLRVGGAG